MSDFQIAISFGLAGVVIWNLGRVVNKLDRIIELLEAAKHKPAEKSDG